MLLNSVGCCWTVKGLLALENQGVVGCKKTLLDYEMVAGAGFEIILLTLGIVEFVLLVVGFIHCFVHKK